MFKLSLARGLSLGSLLLGSEVAGALFGLGVGDGSGLEAGALLTVAVGAGLLFCEEEMLDELPAILGIRPSVDKEL